MLKVKELDKKDIPEIIELSLAIFKPKDRRTHHDPRKWRRYLRDGGILLGAFIDGELVGYLFSYRKSSQHYYTWLGGVKKGFRRRGIMTKLLKTLEEELIHRDCKLLTASSYEEKFPGMFVLLKKEGFKVERTEEVDWYGERVLKSFFNKKLRKLD